MTDLVTTQSIEGYEKAKKILKEYNSGDDIEILTNKLKELEVDYPYLKSINELLEKLGIVKTDSMYQILIPSFIKIIDERIEAIRGKGESEFVKFLYSIADKGELLRIVLFYSDLLILLHKSRREGSYLLQTINKGEETRDSLILKTEITFEKINVKWILKEKEVKEKLEKMKELEVVLKRTIRNLIVDNDFSMLGEFLEKFEPLFKSIFGKSLNYQKYEKSKSMEWIQRKIDENDKRKTYIDQSDNIEFFINTTDLNFKALTFFPFTVSCEECEKTYKIIVKLDPDEYIGGYFEEGYIGFPRDNIITCKCGHVITLSTIRNQIEKATGKKIVTDYEDDKKLVGWITIEISCPICGRESVIYGKFFRSSNIDKLMKEQGIQQIPKNKTFTCECGRGRWDLKNKIKEMEQEIGLKLKY